MVRFPVTGMGFLFWRPLGICLIRDCKNFFSMATCFSLACSSLCSSERLWSPWISFTRSCHVFDFAAIQNMRKYQCHSIAGSSTSASNFFKVSDDEDNNYNSICRKHPRVSVITIQSCKINWEVKGLNTEELNGRKRAAEYEKELQIAWDELLVWKLQHGKA